MSWHQGLACPVAVAVACFAPAAALAQTPATVNARVEISAAVAGSSATLDAVQRQANALIWAQQDEISVLQFRLARAEARGEAEVARLQAELIAAREALVADLASRSRAYAEEIAVFRREVTDIASTPEGATALARFNAGDHVGAIAVLDRLIQVADSARQTRANIEAAAARRRVAILALDARGKSDPAFDTGAVIARFEEVIRLDPGEYNDWYLLVQLYRAAGRNAEALAAAERLEALASDDRERSVAETFTADILLSQGDRDGALVRYQRSLEIVERLSAADPVSADLAADLSALLGQVGDLLVDTEDLLEDPEDLYMPRFTRGLQVFERPVPTEPASADLERDLSVSLIRLGDLLVGQGDRNGAMEHYGRALQIRERLSAADPASTERARDLGVSVSKVGDVHLSRGDRERALFAYEFSLRIAERLSDADPASADRARDVSGLLLRVGDVFLADGEGGEALTRYQRSLEIGERLSAADPASEDLARDVGVSSNKIGDVLLSQGNLEGARQRYQRGLEINERLSSANPASADRARDFGVSQTKIGDVLVSQADRDGAMARYQAALEIFERLSAAEPASADRARDVFLACLKLGEVNGERRWLERALTILRDLEARGALAPSDRPAVARVEAMLAGATPAPN